MPTRADLVRLTLIKLGAVDANEAPEAEDAADVDVHVQAKLEELYSDGLIPFDVDGEVPTRFFVHLAFLCAIDLVGDYAADSRVESVVAGADRGRKALYRYAARPASGAVVPSEYF